MRIRIRALRHYAMFLPIYKTIPFCLNKLCYKYRLSSTPKNDFFFDFFSKMPNLRAEKIFLENLTILAKLTFQALARGISKFSVRWPVFDN